MLLFREPSSKGSHTKIHSSWANAKPPSGVIPAACVDLLGPPWERFQGPLGEAVGGLRVKPGNEPMVGGREGKNVPLALTFWLALGCNKGLRGSSFYHTHFATRGN